MTRRRWTAGDKLPPAGHVPPENLFPLEVRPTVAQRARVYERTIAWIGWTLAVGSLVLIAWAVLAWAP